MSEHTEVKTEQDLIGPGAAVGTVPTDLEQATGLERLEILGKMQGIDIFDMKPLDASRKGTVPVLKNHAISEPASEDVEEGRQWLMGVCRHARQPDCRQELR